ncbi:nucleoside-diphosphate kinase [Spongiactinospora sp. 9N601]|uniref:nucleoside-diphosphate kinase n=1 Tax=Spongiactinospora sp. 9N601 TaxID=3375149 RepID=UPI0037B76339
MILCKPDAVRRGLVPQILAWIATVVNIRITRQVTATEGQILAHYADMVAIDHRFPFDVAAELRRNYAGSAVTVALGHGSCGDTARQVRALLGHYDPKRARTDTIRGHFGIDTAEKAAAEGRFIDNLVHSSDDATGAEREFGIWFDEPFRRYLEEP